MDEEEGGNIIRGGAELCARESEDCRLEASVSTVMDVTHREMQDKMALLGVAIHEVAGVHAADTMESSSSEEEEKDDIGVSSGMREAAVEQADAGNDQEDDKKLAAVLNYHEVPKKPISACFARGSWIRCS